MQGMVIGCGLILGDDLSGSSKVNLAVPFILHAVDSDANSAKRSRQAPK